MERLKSILNASILWRMINALCRFTGHQWKESAVVRWFLNPAPWGQSASETSIFFRIWEAVRNILSKIYTALKMEKLFDGSIFTQLWIWCALPLVLAPIVPTMALLGISAVGFASFALAFIRRRERKLVYCGTNRWIILYAVVYLVSTALSLNVPGTLQTGLLRAAFVLFALVIINGITNRRQLDTLIFLCVLVAAVISLYGIGQYLFGWGYQSAAWWDADMFEGISFRVTSTLENPNMMGQYLILMIPLGGAGLLSARDNRSRIFYFAVCAVMCVCMILTFSRGAWLGLLFAGALFLLFINPRLILLAPVALVGLYFVLPDTVINRFTSIGNLTDNSTSYRVYIWMGTLAMLRDYWLCGVGPGEGAFNTVYPAYSYNGITAPHAHNLLLQIVCDAGVVELLIFLILLVVYARTLCVAISREKEWHSRIHQIALLSGAAGFMVQAMTDYSFYNYRVMFIFWAYLALGVAAIRRNKLPEGGLMT